MTSDRELYAALLGLSRRSPGRPAAAAGPCPRCGARWWGANPEPRQGRTRPPPPTTHSRPKEVKAMLRPSLEELQRQVEEDGGCEATDGCWVEPDG